MSVDNTFFPPYDKGKKIGKYKLSFMRFELEKARGGVGQET